MHLEKHEFYEKPKFEDENFIVKHYAGSVTYNVEGFIEKNTDNLHEDLLDLLNRSEQPVLSKVFSIQRQLKALDEDPFGLTKPDEVKYKQGHGRHRRSGSMSRATSQILGVAMREFGRPRSESLKTSLENAKSMPHTQHSIAGSVTVASTFRNQVSSPEGFSRCPNSISN